MGRPAKRNCRMLPDAGARRGVDDGMVDGWVDG